MMVSHIYMQDKKLKQIFLWPIIIGLLSALSLIVALIKDGVIEQISLLGLVVPIAVIVYFYWIKHNRF